MSSWMDWKYFMDDIYGNDEACFLINMTPKPYVRIVKVEGFSKVEDLLKEAMAKELGELKIEMKPFSIKCLVFEH